MTPTETSKPRTIKYFRKLDSAVFICYFSTFGKGFLKCLTCGSNAMMDRTLDPTTQEDNRIAPVTIDRKELKIGKTRTRVLVGPSHVAI